MNREQLWKNFDLGQELNVSGGFIYEGLRRFHDMQTLENADEIFEFLYSLSIGLERLLKVAVVLIEHDENSDQEEFEKSLITHNHLELLRRIKERYPLSLQTIHNEFLGLLGNFYNKLRYDRFTLVQAWQPDKEKAALRAFLTRNLGSDATKHHEAFALLNTDGFRRHIQKIVGKIAAQLYRVVKSRTAELNLYSHELRSGSKAERIFLKGDVGFIAQDILPKELLIFFMNSKAQTGLLNLLRTIDPLEFDEGLCSEYVQALLSDEGRRDFEDELSALYDNLPKRERKERFELMEIIGNPNVLFPEDEALTEDNQEEALTEDDEDEALTEDVEGEDDKAMAEHDEAEDDTPF